MKLRVILAILMLSTSLCVAGEKPAETAKPEAGAKAEAETGAEILDPAARLKGLEWIKGGPVELKKDAYYVVEFWATWCPPCRVSIPHLTKLQAKFKEKKVTFIGISNETAEKVKPFVEEKGDQMNYVVAIDPKHKVADGYMKAYKQRGIPTAFIVDKQLRVVWVGHPMGDLEMVLEKVIEGKFDAEAYAKQKAEEQKRNAIASKAFRDYFLAIRKEDGTDEAKAAAKLLLENGSSQILNAFSWRLMTEIEEPKRDPALALETAAKANTMAEGKNAAILDTYSLALFRSGKIQRAIAVQEKAVELVSADEKDVKEYQARLNEYREALKKKQ